MADVKVSPDEVLRFQIKRLITLMYKKDLELFEDLADRHDIALSKLRDALPDEYKIYVHLADYFTDEEGVRLRSKVLGNGNDTFRKIEEEILKYKIDFKN